MNKLTKITGSLVLGLGIVGCSDFISGPGLTENPNQPVVVTSNQLLISAQAQQFVRQTGQLARFAGFFTQQLSGTNNQQLQWGSQYLFTDGDISGQFSGFYTGGGLIDLRRIQTDAQTAGIAQLAGIAKIMEGFNMGTAASIWGDIPYREAVGANPTPTLDPQQQVYADVQAVLSEGIGLMGGAGGAGDVDLVYAGNPGRWIRAANTLKARFHLHTAERLGAPAYQAALAAALNGINEAPTTVAQAVHGQAPGDYRALFGADEETGNLWWQFLRARQDFVAGNAMIQILNNRGNDPRREGYFDPAAAVAASATCAGYPVGFRGANQFGSPQPQACATTSVVNNSVRRQPTFRQPLVTWTENQLILAEARFRTGDGPGALVNVNNVRSSLGLAALPGPVTLNQIAEEKYLAMFQNIEAWNDYKRLCYPPQLQPGGSPQAAETPGRLPYGSAERINNPNIPLPSRQPARNWNDPNPCPR